MAFLLYKMTFIASRQFLFFRLDTSSRSFKMQNRIIETPVAKIRMNFGKLKRPRGGLSELQPIALTTRLQQGCCNLVLMLTSHGQYAPSTLCRLLSTLKGKDYFLRDYFRGTSHTLNESMTKSARFFIHWSHRDGAMIERGLGQNYKLLHRSDL